ncbi:hypothetical protein GCM10008938_25210 [Deinococcus roseus]|uniref:Uncharacterized protein n=2 Tax=Deinococcus roseus TaxID=392414 RepID=A0ABQ2D2E8_9DEIO|nr:hypothetical protein GCM10008938_25210 [Deinococcus roseus]
MITLGLGVCGLAQAQTVVEMTALPGTQLTGTLQSTSTITNMTVDVQPKPNVRITSQALEDYRKSFGAGLNPPATTTQNIPATLQVLEDREDGGIPVQMNMDIPMGAGKDPLKFSARTIYYPDGTVKIEFDEVSDPTFQKMLGGMKDLVNNPQLQAIYNKPWTPGESLNQSVSLPFEQFTEGLPYRLTGNFNMNTTTTYVQRGASQEYIFQVNGSSGLTEIRALDDKNNIVMKIFMDQVKVSGENRISEDGLPLFQKTSQSMKMTLIMNMPQVPVIVKTSMNLAVDQTIRWQTVLQ